MIEHYQTAVPLRREALLDFAGQMAASVGLTANVVQLVTSSQGHVLRRLRNVITDDGLHWALHTWFNDDDKGPEGGIGYIESIQYGSGTRRSHRGDASLHQPLGGNRPTWVEAIVTTDPGRVRLYIVHYLDESAYDGFTIAEAGLFTSVLDAGATQPSDVLFSRVTFPPIPKDTRTTITTIWAIQVTQAPSSDGLWSDDGQAKLLRRFIFNVPAEECISRMAFGDKGATTWTGGPLLDPAPVVVSTATLKQAARLYEARGQAGPGVGTGLVCREIGLLQASSDDALYRTTTVGGAPLALAAKAAGETLTGTVKLLADDPNATAMKSLYCQHTSGPTALSTAGVALPLDADEFDNTNGGFTRGADYIEIGEGAVVPVVVTAQVNAIWAAGVTRNNLIVQLQYWNGAVWTDFGPQSAQYVRINAGYNRCSVVVSAPHEPAAPGDRYRALVAIEIGSTGDVTTVNNECYFEVRQL